MTSTVAAPPGLLGAQAPRLSWVPDYASSAGEEVVEAALLAGLVLDPWQELVIRESLGERDDGKWAAKEVGVVVPRQNGKGGLCEARELGGLFVLGERMIIHSAHQYDTSMEAFRRLVLLIEECPDFDRRVKRIVRSHGEEGVELTSGQRIRFRTRTKGGGRGFSCDCLILDEAMILPKAMHGSLMPTLAARDDATVSGTQVWYLGSAVDEQVHVEGQVFAKVRERGIAGGDPRLAFFEWSADPDVYEQDPANPAGWAQANPGLGIRITAEHVAVEQRSLDRRTFATERLGIGHWPSTDGDTTRIVNPDDWRACADPESRIVGPRVFAVEVTPDRSAASITVAGDREDGLGHIEVVASSPGTDWVAGRCSQLRKRDRRARFVIDPRSAAGALLPALHSEGVKPAEITSQQYGQACGSFFDAVKQRRVRYPDPQPELDRALDAAEVRPLGDAWAWERRTLIDMSPLVGATIALWAARNLKPAAPRVVNLAALPPRRPG